MFRDVTVPRTSRHYYSCCTPLSLHGAICSSPVVCYQSTHIRKAEPVCFYSALHIFTLSEQGPRRPCFCLFWPRLWLRLCFRPNVIQLSARVFEGRFREGSFSCSIEPLFACPVITCLLRCPLLPDLLLLPSKATLKLWLRVACRRNAGDGDAS